MSRQKKKNRKQFGFVTKPWNFLTNFSFNSLVRDLGNFGYANFLLEISDLFSPAGSHKQLGTCFVNISSISKYDWQLIIKGV